MHQAVVYVAGPRTQWSGKVDPSEIIARRTTRWQWLARSWARSVHRSLDARRCGYVVLNGADTVEHVQATELLQTL